jgi:hypothetical protein
MPWRFKVKYGGGRHFQSEITLANGSDRHQLAVRFRHAPKSLRGFGKETQARERFRHLKRRAADRSFSECPRENGQRSTWFPFTLEPERLL